MQHHDNFDLAEFREYLTQFEKDLSEGIKKDADYQGEVDELLAALKRLIKELQDKKYQQVLPDLFKVIAFLDMMQEEIEEEEEEEEEKK